MALEYGKAPILMPFFYYITFWRKLLHNLQRLLAYLYQVDAMSCIGERQ